MTNDLSVERKPVDSGLDTFCFSHLRWDFVYQRPQHLMSRFATRGRVFFVEEPMPADGEPRLEMLDRGNNVFVVQPHLPQGLNADEVMPRLIAEFAAAQGVTKAIAWFYTPMMLEWKRELTPLAIVYDCMDELANFKGAPPELIPREQELFKTADIVFTGGHSLYEAKRTQHSNVHAFPSSIDAAHFSKAFEIEGDIPEHLEIPAPRVGFAGVIDERLDIELLAEVADLRPDLSFVMVGPVVKISEADLPRRDNIFYVGGQDYARLPEFMAGWEVGLMPFALNESTRFISPTKTPEYLAAGLPVVSTPITDVVRPYGVEGYVHIASNAQEFADAITAALSEDRERRLARVRELLAGMSWAKTFSEMSAIIDKAVAQNQAGHGASSSTADSDTGGVRAGTVSALASPPVPEPAA
jgi:UDP-galactopyranose mutase